MVIRKQDRVSDVLKHDESLIGVFIALSPAFERLRNRALRRVMAHLVTVEQAARMGGVDPDVLVARLNAADGEAATQPVREPHGDAAPPPAGEQLPPALAALPDDHIVDVDVREDLRNGREPFSRIMAARRRVPDGGALRVRAVFEPVPLYAALGKHGFAHHTEQLGEDDWRVWFYAGEPQNGSVDNAAATTAPATTGAPADAEESTGDEAGLGDGGDAGGVAGDVVVLDVRGLEPPEPMVRTLAVLETLPANATLVQINVRVPQFLLPQLEERGFAYEIREERPDLIRVRIRRAAG